MADPVETNPLGLSDADFLNMVPPTGNSIQTEAPAAPAAGAEVVEEPAQIEEDPADDALPTEPPAGAEGEDPVDKPAGETDPKGDPAPAPAKEEPKVGEDGKPVVTTEGAVPPVGSKEPVAPAAKTGEAAPAGQAEPVDYDAIGKLVMAPFKANGEMLQLKSPEEALKLMQMGAHFTRKMQAIQPHRKVLTMLENNELLDEGKLDFLIAVSKRDPEAIKKLIKDSGIDPLEIDTTVEPQYRAGSHKVTDAEVNFKTALEDITSTPEGKESLKHFNETWDDASKEVVWADPSLLATLNTQKQNGVYDRIEAEINRRRTLGTIGPETSFIGAYQVVGAELHQANAFADITAKVIPPSSEKVAEVPPALTPVATRAAAPKADAANNDKANAAAPSRAGNRPAKPIINPLDMSDEDFAKLPLPLGKALN